MMHSGVLDKLIGKPIRDTYGRYVGTVVGLYFDATGQPKSVGVEEVGGNFVEYTSNRVIFDKDDLLLIPNWKVDVERFTREIDMTQRRANALKDLLNEGEISETAYGDLCKEYDEQIGGLKDSHSMLMDTLSSRTKELERRKVDIEKFLVHIKVQYRTGEIDDDTFKVVSRNLQLMLERDDQEREQILSILNNLESGEAPVKEITVEGSGEEEQVLQD